MSITSKTPKPSKKHARYWLKGIYITITVFISLFTLIYFIMPPLIQYIAIQQLEKQGMSQVSIKQVYWKPWVPHLSFETIQWTTPKLEIVSLETAKITLDRRLLIDKHLSVIDLTITGLNLPIKIQPSIIIGGLSIPTTQEKTSNTEPDQPYNATPWQMSISQLNIENTTFVLSGLPVHNTILQSKTHHLFIKKLSIADFSTMSPQSKSNFAFKGQFNDVAFEINANAAVLSETLPIDAQLTLFPTDPFASAKNILHPNALQGIEGNAALQFELGIDHQNTSAGRQIEIHFNLHTPSLKTTLSKGLNKPIELNLNSLKLTAGTTLHLMPPVFNAQINSQLTIDDLTLKSNNIQANIQQLTSQLKLFDTEGQLTALEQTNINLDGSLELQSLNIESTALKPAIALKNLVTQSTLTGKTLSIPSFSLNNLVVLGEQEPLAQKIETQNLTFGRNELGEKSLKIDSIQITNLNANLELDTENKFTIQSQLDQLQKNMENIVSNTASNTTAEQSNLPTDTNTPNTKSTSNTSSAKKLDWHINTISLIGQNALQLTDNRKGYGVSQTQTLQIQKVQAIQALQKN